MKILHLSSEYPPQQVFGLGMAVEELAVMLQTELDISSFSISI